LQFGTQGIEIPYGSLAGAVAKGRKVELRFMERPLFGSTLFEGRLTIDVVHRESFLTDLQSRFVANPLAGGEAARSRWCQLARRLTVALGVGAVVFIAELAMIRVF